MAKNSVLFRLFLSTAICVSGLYSGGVLEASNRARVMSVARAEIGVKERTGNNDGERVREYLAYCSLPEGYAWCAAFVSWCYGQVGLDEPRNPWSPALLPHSKRLGSVRDAREADVFGVYSASAGRIVHAGLVEHLAGEFLVTVEGNSNDRVERRRRHWRTVHAAADWMSREGGLP